MKKSIKSTVSLMMGMGIAFSCVACAPQETPQEMPKIEATVTVSQFDAPVDLLHTNVLGYLQDDPNVLVSDWLLGGNRREDKGCPVTFEYELKTEADVEVESAQVQVSATEDFAVIIETAEFDRFRPSTANVYRLSVGKKYYYRVNATLTGGQVITSATSSLETANSLQFIALDGANNVRDIGGWKTESGGTVKYGMLYRGSEIDGGKNVGHADFCLTPRGVQQLRALGIKTDFDLRSPDVAKGEHSILGEDVTRKFYNAAQYESALTQAETTRKIFSDLANPEAYPIYLHCTHGVDRAGTTCLLLEGLLGVAKDDLVRDYELSAFYYNYAHVNRNVQNGGNVLNLIEGLEAFEGETFADKVETFMLSIGVTAEEIASIRSIFLG